MRVATSGAESRIFPKSHPSTTLNRWGWIAALVAPLTWGWTGVFVRMLDLSPPTIITGRLFIAFAAFVPWLLMRREGFREAFRTPLTVLMGAYYVLATEAFVYAPVVDVTLVIGASPIIVLIIERLRGGTVSRRALSGAGLSVVGLTIFLGFDASFGHDRLIGDLFAFGASTVSAGYAIGMRARAVSGRAVDPICSTAGACLIGALMGCVLVLVEPSTMSSTMAIRNIGILLPLGLVSTAMPTLAFSIASTCLPALVTTSFRLLTPFCSALFAGWVLKEWPGPEAIAGALLTITGLSFILRSSGVR